MTGLIIVTAAAGVLLAQRLAARERRAALVPVRVAATGPRTLWPR